MNPNTLKNRGKKIIRRNILIIGSLAVAFFLLLQIIAAAATGIVSILAWQYEECRNAANSSDGDGDIGSVSVGNYDKNMASMAKAVADAVGKELGIKPEIIFGQIYQETGLNPNLSTAVKDLNLSGMKYAPSLSKYATPGSSVGDNTGGVYAHFKSLDAYATVYAKTLKNMLGGAKPQTAREYATKLAAKHYFGSYHGGSFYASEAEISAYVAGIETGAKIYRSTKGGSSSSSKGKIKKTAWRDVIQFKDERKLNKNQAKAIKEVLSSAVDIDSPTLEKEVDYLTYKPKQESNLTLITDKKIVYGKENNSENNDSISKSYGDGNSHVKEDNRDANTSDNTSKSTSKKGTVIGNDGTREVVKNADKGKNGAESKSKHKTDNTSESNDESSVDSATCSAFGFDTDSEDGGNVSGKWQWPFKGISGSPSYLDGGQFGTSSGSAGARGTSFHDGFDWSNGLNGVHIGSKIYAITDGKVYKIGNGGARGWFIDIKAGDYYITYQEAFASRSSIKVKEGQTIKAGDLIGVLDDAASGHLHMGISKKEIESAQSSWNKNDGTWLDPIKIIKEGMKQKNSSNGTSSGSSSLKLSKEEDAARRWIVQRESSGSYTVPNGKYYGAYQLDKSYITSKKYGGDGTLSKKNQDYVAQKYMESRYGTWQKAKAFWQANGWW